MHELRQSLLQPGPIDVRWDWIIGNQCDDTGIDARSDRPEVQVADPVAGMAFDDVSHLIIEFMHLAIK